MYLYSAQGGTTLITREDTKMINTQFLPLEELIFILIGRETQYKTKALSFTKSNEVGDLTDQFKEI